MTEPDGKQITEVRRPGEGDSRDEDIERLETLAWWLDERFRVPFTNLRFGLDGLLGVVPGIGDFATALTGFLLISTAHSMGVPVAVLLRMAANLALDFVVGLIPVAGDVFDFVFKAHRRNVDLVRRHLEDE